MMDVIILRFSSGGNLRRCFTEYDWVSLLFYVIRISCSEWNLILLKDYIGLSSKETTLHYSSINRNEFNESIICLNTRNTFSGEPYWKRKDVYSIDLKRLVYFVIYQPKTMVNKNVSPKLLTFNSLIQFNNNKNYSFSHKFVDLFCEWKHIFFGIMARC